MKLFLVDEGILLNKESENTSYSVVYDKRFAYYDENQFYELKKERAVELAKEYVSHGVEGTYAIVSNTELDDIVSVEDIKAGDVDVSGETYHVDDIVYSIREKDGNIIENFVCTNGCYGSGSKACLNHCHNCD